MTCRQGGSELGDEGSGRASGVRGGDCYNRSFNELFRALFMTQVTVGENEGIESALRRFKRQVSKAGIFADLKRLRHHETPTEKYKRKAQQRRRRR